jgi:hypothetical protein
MGVTRRESVVDPDGMVWAGWSAPESCGVPGHLLTTRGCRDCLAALYHAPDPRATVLILLGGSCVGCGTGRHLRPAYELGGRWSRASGEGPWERVALELLAGSERWRVVCLPCSRKPAAQSQAAGR